MKTNARKKLLFFATVLAALTLTTTSLAQVTIVNVYGIETSSVTPPVHIVSGINNSSSLTVAVNQMGTHAYINMTQYFQLGGQNSVNLTDLVKLVSAAATDFGYVSNVTLFNGQKTTQAVVLYSTDSNGSYLNDYNFTATNSYSNGTTPTYVSHGGNSSFGLYIQLGKSGLAGPYHWNLDFQINGFYFGNSGAPSVYTQYFVNISVTTFEVT